MKNMSWMFVQGHDRLDRELGVINKLGFPNYFLIVWDFVRFSWEPGAVTEGVERIRGRTQPEDVWAQPAGR